MSDEILPIADGFWNIRGTFRLAGLVNVGTQSSLVRLRSGNFVLLDCYELEGEIRDQVMALTEGGQKLEAILNLHPFHTVHVKAVAELFPKARLHGTARHHSQCPSLRWEPEHTEDAALHQRYAEDFVFSVPRGTPLVPDDDKVHFASVLAIHTPSQTLHVDDTLIWNPLPLVGGLAFHPTLNKALERRAGAAAEFRGWAEELIELCRGVTHLCTAHGAKLPPQQPETPYHEQVRQALASEEEMLRKHAAKYG